MADEERAPPDRSEFHEIRSRGIGGSDAAVILGLNAWKTPLQLYYEKRKEYEEEWDEERQELEWGNRLEGPIIDKLRDKTKRIVMHHTHKSGFRQSLKLSWLICHLDGEWWEWTEDKSPSARYLKETRSSGIVEVKNVTGWKVDDWGMVPPLYVQAQVQHNMAVTGLPSAAVAALLGGNQFRHFDLDPNVRFIRAMLEMESDFWHRVKTGHEPKAGHRDTKFISQFFKVVAKTVITLPGEALELDAVREHAAERLKAWKEIKDGAEARIKQLIGTNEQANLTSGVTYRHGEVKGGDVSYYRKPSRTLTRRKRK